jgi:hypothetical protein
LVGFGHQKVAFCYLHCLTYSQLVPVTAASFGSALA